ncbi:hypothetical protein [Azoarcus sp. DN11]|uniref:hypothetical protein n=1 Tax=Azoarcus sp. DN11 TaxID=356837 RepID=UPI000EADF1EB|nr:hypothetical protein [Azoarcus sp. DN11]AYH43986.1 hypothetical protein CDA09_11420 [Azoarcus sp. DN11]
MNRFAITVAGLWCLAVLPAQGADLRERMRAAQAGGVKITEAQASDLTLTLTEASVRPIQTWIRTVGTVDPGGRTISARLSTLEADGLQVGQRTRSFAANARTQMHQGKTVKVLRQTGGVLVQATLADQGHSPGARYLMEIVVERGPYLSIPNVSIIEDGGEQVAYIEMQPAGSGLYAPRSIRTGLKGELYTEVRHGLFERDRVVSIGSFFVDAEEKLKAPGQDMCSITPPSNEHHHH